MAKRNRNRTKNHKKNRRATRRVTKRGGGWGYNASSTDGITPGTVSNQVAWTAIGDCRAQKPDYEIPYSDYAKYSGLPGLSQPAQFQTGGKSRKNRKQRKSRKQKGGRYGFAPDMIDGVTPNGAAWWAGTYAPVQRIPCEAAATTHNPLNPLPTTPITAPYPPQVDTTPRIETQIASQSGGASAIAPATYGVGDTDSMYYYGPTAGYDNVPSTWKDSVGAPVQLQIPFAARAYNPACMTTEHPPPLTGALYVAKGGGVGAATAGVVNTTVGALTGAVGTSAGLAAGAAGTMAGTAAQLVGTAGQVGSTITSAPAQAVGTAFQGLASGATGAVTGMTGAVTNAGLGYVDVLTKAGTGFANAGRALVGGRRNNNSLSVTAYVANNSSRKNLPAVPANALPSNMKMNNKNNKKGLLNTATNAITGTANNLVSGVGNLFSSSPAANTAMLGGKRKSKKERKNRKTRKANRR